MYVTLRSSTCFEQHAAHPQEDKLYHHSLWYRHSSQTAVQYAGGERTAVRSPPAYCIILFLPKIRVNTGLFKMTVGVLTTCHTQYTADRSICIFLFNRTTLTVFVTYLTGALNVHPL